MDADKGLEWSLAHRASSKPHLLLLTAACLLLNSMFLPLFTLPETSWKVVLHWTTVAFPKLEQTDVLTSSAPGWSCCVTQQAGPWGEPCSPWLSLQVKVAIITDRGHHTPES